MAPIYIDADLRADAHAAGQLFTPTVWDLSGADFEAVLDNPTVSATAISNLVTLATTRADGPWDGVDINLEGLSDGYRDKLSAWYIAAVEALHAAGLQVSISYTAPIADSGVGAGTDRLVHDVGFLTDVVDTMTLVLYSSLDMTPNTAPGPYGYERRVLDYVASKGINFGRTFAGLCVTSKYWHNGASVHYSYEKGQEVLTGAGEVTRWYELGADGRRFSLHHAAWATDELWVVNGDTLGAHLNLVDEYGMAGACLFLLGCESADAWPVLNDWIAGSRPHWHGYIALERVDMAAGSFTTFLNYAKARGQRRVRQPHRLNHWRTIDANTVLIEAEWGYGEAAAAHCDDWLGALLDVDVGDIGHTNTTVTYAVRETPVTLFSHGGTDYLRLRIFGGLDATWEQSQVEALAYL